MGGFYYENAQKLVRVRAPKRGQTGAIWRFAGGVRGGGEKGDAHRSEKWRKRCL